MSADTADRQPRGPAPQAPVPRAEIVRRQFRGALVGVAVGDCLGAPFEGHPGPVSPELFAGVETSDHPLSYTDDTAMTLALAESLLACDGLDLDHLASAFAASFRAEPHRGYGAGAADLLARIAAGDGWRQLAADQFGGRGSFGNGSAMRIAPIALYAHPSVASAAELGRASATVTHTHPEAIDAAGIQAAAVTLALSDEAPTGIGQFVARLRELTHTAELEDALAAIEDLPAGSGPEDVAMRTGTGIRAAEAVPAAIAAAALNLGSFPETIRFAVAMGGDTDTIAAMAGAIAGARLGEDGIPARWVTRSEGAEQARSLADRLAARAAPPQRAGRTDARPPADI